jgi:hypothetical protein
MLGCTHFPFEADRFRAAFARLREFTDGAGAQPYRDLIAADLELVDPAALTAKELFRSLFLARRRTSKTRETTPEARHSRGSNVTINDPNFWQRDQLFVSIPAPEAPTGAVQDDGWFTHDYKYGRSAGGDGADTRIVPLHPDRMPTAIRDLIRSRCPEVWQVLQ